jgi:hypothetical protein
MASPLAAVFFALMALPGVEAQANYNGAVLVGGEVRGRAAAAKRPAPDPPAVAASRALPPPPPADEVSDEPADDRAVDPDYNRPEMAPVGSSRMFLGTALNLLAGRGYIEVGDAVDMVGRKARLAGTIVCDTTMGGYAIELNGGRYTSMAVLIQATSAWGLSFRTITIGPSGRTIHEMVVAARAS